MPGGGGGFFICGGGPGGGVGLERSTNSSFFAASRARLLRASSCNWRTSPSLKANKSRMGTPACVTLKLPRYTRRRALSLGDVLGSLSSSETSVLTYSHYWFRSSSPNVVERLPQQGPTPSGAAPRCKHALVQRTLATYRRCPGCPSRLRTLLFLSRRVAPRPHLTTARGRPCQLLIVDAASWS